MKKNNPYNPITEPASYAWFEEKPEDFKERISPLVRTYTEKELLLAVKYACEYQKASCYQEVGGVIAFRDGYNISKDENKILDILADQTTITNTEIELQDLHEYFEENK